MDPHRRLRLGIVGLGRLWEARHAPALAQLADQAEIVAVYDPVARRAEIEAQTRGCETALGLVSLAERPDIDALYVLGPLWFGLHAAQVACQLGKPVYCGMPIAADPSGLETLARTASQNHVLVVPELARRFYPATLRLRELLATVLGPPRLILGHVRLLGFDRFGPPGPSSQLVPLPLAVDPGANLIDWCRFVFHAEPSSILATASACLTDPGESTSPDFVGFTMEFPQGATAQIDVGRFQRPSWNDASRFLPPPGIQVFAERGAAWLEMPDRIHWTTPEGPREEHLPQEPPLGALLSDHFFRLLRGEQSLSPRLDDALAACRIVQALEQSRREGRSIALTPPDTP